MCLHFCLLISLGWTCTPSNLGRNRAGRAPQSSESLFSAPFMLHTLPRFYSILTYSDILQVIQTRVRTIYEDTFISKAIHNFPISQIYMIVITVIQLKIYSKYESNFLKVVNTEWMYHLVQIFRMCLYLSILSLLSNPAIPVLLLKSC